MKPIFTVDELNRLQALVQERLCYPALRATEEEALVNIDNKLAELLPIAQDEEGRK